MERDTTTARRTLLGLAFLGAGGAKLTGVQDQVDEFERFGLPQPVRVATGAAEAGGAAAVLLGGTAATLGSAGLLATMLGAVVTHVRVRDSVPRMLPAAALGGLAASVLRDQLR